MLPREFYYKWELELLSNPDQLWPLVADTNRFNRDTGLPSLQNLEKPNSTGNNARRRLRFYRMGLPITWEEDPFEWVRPYRFGVERRYSTGPLKVMRVLLQMEKKPGSGTVLTYEVWASAANLFGRLAIPVQIGILSARSFVQTFLRYDQVIQQGHVPEGKSSPKFVQGGKSRLAQLRHELNRQNAHPQAADQLSTLIEQGDDLSLAYMRPYTLADYWKTPRKETLETFLWATRIGMLDFRWQLLCPLCRVARDTAKNLARLDPHAHCDTCNIDYEVNFDQMVELSFRPNGAIRQTPEGIEFCVGGPQVTPHVVFQLLLTPGASRSVAPTLEAGRYRLRVLDKQGSLFFKVTPQGKKQVHFTLSNSDWSTGEIELTSGPTLQIENLGDQERLIIFERMAWGDEAVTAAEVIAMQTFRDLFSNEALRPGDQISVGSTAIVFTDLRDSTVLYRQLGDAPAFGKVMDHFDIMHECVAAEGGAIVKTMGDAVMAVFQQPTAAIRAFRAAQDILNAPPPGTLPLRLKVGIHYGPAIAVNLNGQMDYFGTTVNLAARMVDFSRGSDLIISSEVREHPAVVRLLQDNNLDIRVQKLDAILKDFDDLYYELWRLRPASIDIMH